MRRKKEPYQLVQDALDLLKDSLLGAYPEREDVHELFNAFDDELADLLGYGSGDPVINESSIQAVLEP